MPERIERTRRGSAGTATWRGAMGWQVAWGGALRFVRARAVLLVVGVGCSGLGWAQVGSGATAPFAAADVVIAAGVALPGGVTEVETALRIDTESPGGAFGAVVAAWCRILPCSGDDEGAQALARAEAPHVGDERTGIVVGSGAVGVGDFFGGIAVLETVYEWGFFTRFAPDATVRIRTVTFAEDAFLTDAYLRELGLEGTHYVPAGTYYVLDRKLSITVLKQR